MKTVSIEVSDSVAERLMKMTDHERKLVSEALNRIVLQRRSLKEIMQEASAQARENGLTPEMLTSLLNEGK